MTPRWEKYEHDIHDYLTEHFPDVTIRHHGGSDSTISDIEIGDDPSFFIDVKSPASQAGQFVCQEKNGHYTFSTRNKSTPSQYTDAIISYLNQTRPCITTRGVILYSLGDIPTRHVINLYRHKNVRYIATGNTDQPLFIPLERIGDYFNINCVARVKKSGSSRITPRDYQDVITGLDDLGVTVTEISPTEVLCDGHAPEYLLTPATGDRVIRVKRKSPGQYVARKLSNTANVTVICELTLSRFNQDADDYQRFLDDVDAVR